MPDYVKLAATAKRLIEASGRTVSVRRLDRTIAEADRPWRGVPDPRADPDASASVKAVFVDPVSAARMGFLVADPNLVSKIDSVALVAATSTTEALETFDELADGLQLLKLDSVDVLKPGSTKLMYVLRLVSTGNTLPAPEIPPPLVERAFSSGFSLGFE